MTDGKAKLEGVARLAEQAQPKGSTLDSAGVHTPVSSVLELKAAQESFLNSECDRAQC